MPFVSAAGSRPAVETLQLIAQRCRRRRRWERPPDCRRRTAASPLASAANTRSASNGSASSGPVGQRKCTEPVAVRSKMVRYRPFTPGTVNSISVPSGWTPSSGENAIGSVPRSASCCSAVSVRSASIAVFSPSTSRFSATTSRTLLASAPLGRVEDRGCAAASSSTSDHAVDAVDRVDQRLVGAAALYGCGWRCRSSGPAPGRCRRPR